jgi:hypothetical protein
MKNVLCLQKVKGVGNTQEYPKSSRLPERTWVSWKYSMTLTVYCKYYQMLVIFKVRYLIKKRSDVSCQEIFEPFIKEAWNIQDQACNGKEIYKTDKVIDKFNIEEFYDKIGEVYTEHKRNQYAGYEVLRNKNMRNK